MSWLKGIWSLASGVMGGSIGWLVLGLALFGVGGWAGHDLASNKCAADKLTKVQQQHDAFVQAVIDGGHDARALRDELVAAETTNAQLKERLKHVPTIAKQQAAPGCPVCDARLTDGAVGLWDAALTGVPTDTCGADGAASEACLAATDITPDQAAANHAENAKACRADRTRYQRLIDHLAKRPGAT